MASLMHLHNEEEFSDSCKDGSSVMSCCRDAIISSVYDLMNYNGSQKDVPITIADFGTADGSIAIPILNEVIDTIRQHSKGKEILLIFEEQPAADFNALVKEINGMNPTQKCSLNLDENISVLYSATDMYKRCFPSKSLDIVLCSVAMHWFSKLPCNIRNGIVECDADESELLLLKKQSAEDYEKFLINRGEELKHGGKMIVSTLARFPDGRHSLALAGKFSTLGAALENLLDLGSITQTEYVNITIPFGVGRTEKELRFPFDSGNADIMRIGLFLESLNFKEAFFVSALDEEAIDGPALDNYAESVVAAIKPWLYNTVYSGLDKNRVDQEKICIVETYFKMVKEYAKKHPQHPVVVRFAEIVIKRK